jgi:5-methylcytosine-specific restriction protein A
VPTRLCSQPGCGSPATYRGRCATHATQNNTATHQNRSVYNSKRWRVLRRMVLYNTPLCGECGNIATDADHITPIEDGGAPWDMMNLSSLCHPCHSRKTRHEQQTRNAASTQSQGPS